MVPLTSAKKILTHRVEIRMSLDSGRGGWGQRREKGNRGAQM